MCLPGASCSEVSAFVKGSCGSLRRLPMDVSRVMEATACAYDAPLIPLAGCNGSPVGALKAYTGQSRFPLRRPSDPQWHRVPAWVHPGGVSKYGFVARPPRLHSAVSSGAAVKRDSMAQRMPIGIEFRHVWQRATSIGLHVRVRQEVDVYPERPDRGKIPEVPMWSQYRDSQWHRLRNRTWAVRWRGDEATGSPDGSRNGEVCMCSPVTRISPEIPQRMIRRSRQRLLFLAV
jgi:hypothetical protein